MKVEQPYEQKKEKESFHMLSFNKSWKTTSGSWTYNNGVHKKTIVHCLLFSKIVPLPQPAKWSTLGAETLEPERLKSSDQVTWKPPPQDVRNTRRHRGSKRRVPAMHPRARMTSLPVLDNDILWSDDKVQTGKRNPSHPWSERVAVLRSSWGTVVVPQPRLGWGSHPLGVARHIRTDLRSPTGWRAENQPSSPWPGWRCPRWSNAGWCCRPCWPGPCGEEPSAVKTQKSRKTHNWNSVQWWRFFRAGPLCSCWMNWGQVPRWNIC